MMTVRPLTFELPGLILKTRPAYFNRSPRARGHGTVLNNTERSRKATQGDCGTLEEIDAGYPDHDSDELWARILSDRLQIPEGSYARVQWFAELFEAVTADAWRTGNLMVEEQNAPTAAGRFFIEDYARWLKESVGMAVDQAVVMWAALRE